MLIWHQLERVCFVYSQKLTSCFIKKFQLEFLHFFPQILNTQITDIGRYVCIAENTAGSAKKYFNLNVHGKSSVPKPSVRVCLEKQETVFQIMQAYFAFFNLNNVWSLHSFNLSPSFFLPQLVRFIKYKSFRESVFILFQSLKKKELLLHI